MTVAVLPCQGEFGIIPSYDCAVSGSLGQHVCVKDEQHEQVHPPHVKVNQPAYNPDRKGNGQCRQPVPAASADTHCRPAIGWVCREDAWQQAGVDGWDAVASTAP